MTVFHVTVMEPRDTVLRREWQSHRIIKRFRIASPLEALRVYREAMAAGLRASVREVTSDGRRN